MKNYEWITTEYPDLVSQLIAGVENSTPSVYGIALKLDGTPCLCKDIACTDCKFYKNTIKTDSNCSKAVLDWLDKEHIENNIVKNTQDLINAFNKWVDDQYGNMFSAHKVIEFLKSIEIKGEK